MATTYYKKSDAGAPTGAGAGAYGSLINILDGLVAGYGTKPAIGWSTAFTATNKRAYRLGAGTTQKYLRVDETGTAGYPRFIGYGSMTDIDTGVSPFPTNIAVSGGLSVPMPSAAPTAWEAMSDGKYLHLWIQMGSSLAYISFGDPRPTKATDTGHTFIHGAISVGSSTAFSGNLNSSNVSGGYFATSFTQIGSGVGACKISHYLAGTTLGSGLAAYPNQDGSLITAPVLLSEFGTAHNVRAVIPGMMAACFSATGINHGDTYTDPTTNRSYVWWKFDGNAGAFIETTNWA